MSEVDHDVICVLEAAFAAASPLAEQRRRALLTSHEGRRSDGKLAVMASADDAADVLELARTHYRTVGTAEWREGASLEDWAGAYRHSYAMRTFDLMAATVHNRVEEEVRRRFGLDIRECLRVYLQRSADVGAVTSGRRPTVAADSDRRPSRDPVPADSGHDAPTSSKKAEPVVRRPASVSRSSAVHLDDRSEPAEARAETMGALEVGSAGVDELKAARAVWSARLREVHIAELLVSELLPDAPASARAIAADRLASASAAAVTAEGDVQRASAVLRAQAVLPGDGGPPARHLLDADEWVRLWLLPRWRPHRAVRWCPRWWSHPEASSRIEGIWRAWRELCRAEGVGLSQWWRDHADYHLGVLTSADGPFARCPPDGDDHQEVEVLTALVRPSAAAFTHTQDPAA